MKRRNIDYLESWLIKPNRKPLILSGARQVGKSFLVRDFAKRNQFDILEINFEYLPESISLFRAKDVDRIKILLQAQFGKKLNAKSLLFLDEVQTVPEIFSVLRFFYEAKIDFPIIAAGSFLEFAMEEKEFSMPDGRLEYHFLGPMSFEEFLRAIEEIEILDFLQSYQLKDLIPESLHFKILDLFLIYMNLGGMPEVIQSYLDNKDFALCNELKSNLLNTYEDDFHKYKKRLPWDRIRKVFRYIPLQLGTKFKYSKISQEERAKALSDALTLLCQAQVAHKVNLSYANGVPLGAQIKENYFKVLSLDFGLTSFLLGMRTVVDLNNWNPNYKGALFEQIIGQHLLFSQSPFVKPEIYTWAREKAQSSFSSCRSQFSIGPGWSEPFSAGIFCAKNFLASSIWSPFIQ